MKIGAIVAEFNPFHNGHASLVAAAREAGMTHVIAVMSGNFVQRGEPSIADKHIRTRSALAGGVDLVLELPLPYATATAQRFALGAVRLLHGAGIVDTLVFGSEEGSVQNLEAISRLVDTHKVQQAVGGFMAEGMTFAKARQMAVSQVGGEQLGELLSHPNNALAVEYLRQARIVGWAPEIFTIPRKGTGHDAPTPVSSFASASYLRNHATDFDLMSGYMPIHSLDILQDACRQGFYPADPERLDNAILAHLRRLPLETLAQLPDLSEGIENRLHDAIRQASDMEELRSLVKTKRYTLARVRRLILTAFLGITYRDLETTPPYLRVLGYREEARPLMGMLGKSAKLPLGTSLLPLREQSKAAHRLATLEETAGDLYELALPKPRPCGQELRARLVVYPG